MLRNVSGIDGRIDSESLNGSDSAIVLSLGKRNKTST